MVYHNPKKAKCDTNSHEEFVYKEYTFKEMLYGWSDMFIKKIDSNYTAQVNFKLSDLNQDIYHVEFKN